MNAVDFFFYEWLIVEKKVSEEAFKALTEEEYAALKQEFARQLPGMQIVSL